jgi:hypothetical protein
MAKTKFRELYNARSPKARARVEARVRQALAEMPALEVQQNRQLKGNGGPLKSEQGNAGLEALAGRETLD